MFFAASPPTRSRPSARPTITAQEFQNELQNVLYRYQRQCDSAADQRAGARARASTRRCSARMIDEAALNSARAIARAWRFRTKPSPTPRAPIRICRTPSGQFNRAMFDSGAARFRPQRARLLRQAARRSICASRSNMRSSTASTPPKPLLEALAGAETQTREHRLFRASRRAPPATFPAPSAETLKSYFDDRKSSYRAPEFRAHRHPARLARPRSPSPPKSPTRTPRRDTKRPRTSASPSPEKRKLQQIVFPTEAEANEAEAKIKAGASFDDIAKARNLADADLDLGEISKADDRSIPPIADAAFALPEGGVSGVVKGQFGFLHRPRASRSRPASVQAASRMSRTRSRKMIATERASTEVQAIHDKIEDAARRRQIARRGRQGGRARGPRHRRVDASGSIATASRRRRCRRRPPLLRAVFASDVGVDDAALNTKDRGFVWFDVTKVDPAHDRTFDEVKDKVEKQWRAEEVAKALTAKAADLVKQLDAGATIAEPRPEPRASKSKSATASAAAAAAGLPTSVVDRHLRPAAGQGGLGRDARRAARLQGHQRRDAALRPADADVKIAGGQSAATDCSDSRSTQYVAALQKQLGVTINERRPAGRRRRLSMSASDARAMATSFARRYASGRASVLRHDAGRRPGDPGLRLSEARRGPRAATCSCSNRSRAARSAAAIR